VIKRGLIYDDDDDDDDDEGDDKLLRIIPKQELREIYKSPHLIADIKLRMLVCQGHVIIVGQKRLAKPEGRWKFGEPRLKWLEDPENNLPDLKAERRKQRANARKEYLSRKEGDLVVKE
jgi:hypothetical protein